jgi:hypothetical protein
MASQRARIRDARCCRRRRGDHRGVGAQRATGRDTQSPASARLRRQVATLVRQGIEAMRVADRRGSPAERGGRRLFDPRRAIAVVDSVRSVDASRQLKAHSPAERASPIALRLCPADSPNPRKTHDRAPNGLARVRSVNEPARP